MKFCRPHRAAGAPCNCPQHHQQRLVVVVAAYAPTCVMAVHSAELDLTTPRDTDLKSPNCRVLASAMVNTSLADPLCVLESGSRGSAGAVTSRNTTTHIASRWMHRVTHDKSNRPSSRRISAALRRGSSPLSSTQNRSSEAFSDLKS